MYIIFVSNLSCSVSYSVYSCISHDVENSKSKSLHCRNWLCIIIENMAESIENLGLSHETLWSDFTKLALKISLQTGNATLMRTFKTVCSKTITKECQASASTIFQMTVSHSAFVNTMLSDSDLKCKFSVTYLRVSQFTIS